MKDVLDKDRKKWYVRLKSTLSRVNVFCALEPFLYNFFQGHLLLSWSLFLVVTFLDI